MASTIPTPPLVPKSTLPQSTPQINQTTSLRSKGIALFDLRKYNESITNYDKALAINPKDVSVLDLKGIDLFYLGKYNESITNYDKALAINPKDVNALTGLGAALGYGLGKYNESITNYDKALAINPNYFVAVKEKQFIVATAARKANSTATKKP